eukprot:647120-Amphidinium_carterae.2
MEEFAELLLVLHGRLNFNAMKTLKSPPQSTNMPLCRISVAELASNATIRSGLHAYVLIGHVESQWKAANWTLDYLKEKIPFEWVDYYEKNMRQAYSAAHGLAMAETHPSREVPHGSAAVN